jgi:hypothetical protein
MTKLEELEAIRDAAVAVYYAAEAYDVAYEAELKKQKDKANE